MRGHRKHRVNLDNKRCKGVYKQGIAWKSLRMKALPNAQGSLGTSLSYLTKTGSSKEKLVDDIGLSFVALILRIPHIRSATTFAANSAHMKARLQGPRNLQDCGVKLCKSEYMK